jgi:hypothetical protein
MCARRALRVNKTKYFNDAFNLKSLLAQLNILDQTRVIASPTITPNRLKGIPR